MPSATAFVPNLAPYFKLDGSRTITGPTTIDNETAAGAVLTLQGAPAQAGDLLRLQNSAGTDLVHWLSDGREQVTTTLTGAASVRYGVLRTLTLDATAQDLTGMRQVATLASDKSIGSWFGISNAITTNGPTGSLYNNFSSVSSTSASAQTEHYAYYGSVVHSGAGLLSYQIGAYYTTRNTGPVTSHNGLWVDATTAAATGTGYGAQVNVFNTGTTSTETIGVRATASNTGTTPVLIGVEAIVSGTATTKYALRATGAGSYFGGDITLTGVFKKTDTNNYELSFGHNSNYSRPQIRIIDAGNSGRGFVITNSSGIVTPMNELGNTIAQFQADKVYATGYAPIGLSATTIVGSGAGLAFSDFLASSVTYLSMLNKVHTYADGSSMAFGTTNGMKIGTATTQRIGFYNTTPVAQQTVTGSRGGNAALANLLTTLATLGLIVDSTSA